MSKVSEPRLRFDATRRRVALALGLSLLALTGGSPSALADTKLKVVTTIAQIGEPLRAIAEPRARVEILLGEGVDPHLYKPTRSDIARVANADLVFWSGLHLEAQMADMLGRLAARKPVIAVAERVPADRLLDAGAGLPDPHIWMDPGLWQVAVGAAVETLADADPEGAAFYRANAHAYFARMAAVEAYAERAIGSVPAEGRALVTAHDAFGYFGARFGLDVLAIQGISTDSEAGLRRIEELVDAIVAREVRAVFVETSVSDRNVRALIEGARARGHEVSVGGELFSDAMGAPGTYEGTYVGMIDHNATVIARALGGDAPEGGMSGLLAHSN